MLYFDDYSAPISKMFYHQTSVSYTFYIISVGGKHVGSQNNAEIQFLNGHYECFLHVHKN